MKKLFKISLALFAFGLFACNSGFTNTQSCDGVYKIGSFNILGGKNGNEGVMERANIGASIVRYHDWDIYGSQEMFDFQLEIYLGSDEVYDYAGRACCKENEDAKGQKWGNYIIFKKEKFEVLKSGHFWLSETPAEPSKGWDEKQYRICNWAKFRDKRTGGEFFFFNLHQGLTKTSRYGSAKLIFSKIMEIAGKGSTIFMTGDFNATIDQDSIEEILKDGILSDSWSICNTMPYGNLGTFMPANHNKPICDKSGKSGGKKIDYVFVSKNVEVLKCAVLSDNLDGKYPSDHFPIMTVVKVN